MKVADFDYELPEDRIAQSPAEPRDAARLLVHEIARDRTRIDLSIRDLSSVLRRGDLLVVNDTRVRPARLLGVRRTGGRVELLLLSGPSSSAISESQCWTALVKPAGRLKVDEEIELEDGSLRARALERLRTDDGDVGAEWRIELRASSTRETLDSVLARVGRMPLPPYIRRSTVPGAVDPRHEADGASYQTMFACTPGAVAAPTAGLHFTPELMASLEAAGVGVATVTLHVGPGTFRPVSVESVRDHQMHSEEYVCSAETARAIDEARERGGHVIAVGTTCARVLESCSTEDGRIEPGRGTTTIFITPGHRFRAIDALLTNFHLPRSTLLMLVSAFAGRERVLRLYAEAVAAEYRFLSYGDAMLLLP